MQNSEYWKIRFKQLEEAQNQTGIAAYAELEKQYRQAQKELEGKINTWYQRLASNNGVTIAEARKLLSSNEWKEFRWDVQEYIRYGKKNAVNGKWMKELENASARFHITRLEALKLQTQQSLEVLFGNQLDSIDAAMKKIYLDGYYHTAYELQKGFRIGWDIAGLDQAQIKKVIAKPWAVDGKNFSERIWSNKEKLISEVHGELTQNIMLGKDPQKAIDAIAKKMNTSTYNAGRLVMTEEAYFSSAAQKDCFNDLDVEEYEIVATLDSHTSDICQEMDGKVFSMKDFEPGVTAPPFHVYCRSTTIPHFDDDFGQAGERAARDEKTGKTYYVPDNMNYQEWKRIFVDDANESDKNKLIQKAKNTIDILTRSIPPVSLKDLQTPYIESISKTINTAPELFQKVIKKNQDNIIFAKTEAIGKSKYSANYGIFINLKKDFSDIRGQWTGMFHEMGHNLDKLYGRTSESVDFINALKSDFSIFTNRYTKLYNINLEKAYEDISEALWNATAEESHIISDLFGALSKGKCEDGYHHEQIYWKSDEVIGHEAFAHFFSASIINSKVKLEALKKVFPNAYDNFLKLIGDMNE